jgi:2-polyprenyl-3-methyl-5-hydroxy-6-metoxy-1,4-benzoquinol methylase
MKNNFHYKRSTCRLCNSKKVKLKLNMPKSQPVDNFRTYDDNQILLPSFNMDLYQCSVCGHAQLLDVVSPKILYSDYVYKSSQSPDLKKHFVNYSKFLFDFGYAKKNQKVLDIGSNDGLFLDILKRKGIKTYGIDPAVDVVNISKKKGHQVICDFLSPTSIIKIKKKFSSKFNLITANNVFSHSDNLQLSLKCISQLLNHNGYYVFEVSYLLDTINSRVIDYIYHEHLSYHSIKALVPFLRKQNLYIYDVIKVPTKGGSIRVVCGKKKEKENKLLINSMIAAENALGLYGDELYKEIENEIIYSKKIILSWFNKIKRKNKKIIFLGYGACATGTVLSSMLDIEKHLSGFVEDNKDKHGKLSPNSFLPVLNINKVDKKMNVCFIILAWRFKDQIINNIKKKYSRKAKIIALKPSLKKIEYL